MRKKLQLNSEMWVLVIALVFQAVAVFQHGVSTSYWILFFVGIWYLFTRPSNFRSSVEVFTLFIFIYLATILLSFINVDDWAAALKHTHRVLTISLLPVIYHSLVSAGLRLKHLYWGSVLAGCSFLAVAIYEVHFLGNPAAVGPYNQIMYGSMAVLSALVALSWFVNAENRWERWTAIVGHGFCLYSAILSTSRGAWLGLIGGYMVIMIFHWPRSESKHLRSIKVTGIALAVVLSLYFAGDVLVERTVAAYKDLQFLISGENLNTSLGLRFLLWKAALQMWSYSPIVGVGFGDFPYELSHRMAGEEINFLLRYGHGYAHNIYLEALATTGLLGFLSSSIALVVFPLIMYWRFYRVVGSDIEAKNAAVLGIALTLAFAMYGLTENWPVHSQLVMYFTFIQAACVSVITGRLVKIEKVNYERP